VPLFCLVSAVSGGPWYLRNWMLTGNPIYPMDPGLGLPGNPVHLLLTAAFRQWFLRDLDHFQIAERIALALKLLAGAPLALTLGVCGLAFTGKRAIALGAAALLLFALWLWSVPFTAGGMVYSMRVLTPAWVVLAVAAGALGRLLARPLDRWKSVLVWSLSLLTLAPCGAYALVSCWSHPFPPREIGTAISSTLADPLDMWQVQISLAKTLEATPFPATNILTDDFYLAAALQRYSRFRAVMVWSPDAADVFDRSLDAREVRRRLRAKGIGGVTVSAGQSSPNTPALMQLPFFRDDLPHWIPVVAAPKMEAILLLPGDDAANRR
jgi:hypothetical protein